MKKIFIALIIVLLQSSLYSVYSQVTIATDVETNAPYDDGFHNGDNGGSGFNAWVITTTGGGGSYAGSSGQSSNSLAIYTDATGTAVAKRTFTFGDMLPGHKLSIDIGHTATINGEIGINLLDGSSPVITLKFVNGDSNWLFNNGGSDFNAGQNYSANTSLTFTFTYEGGSNYSYTFGSGSGSNHTASNIISGIDGFQVYATNQGASQNVGFDNIKLEGGTLKITGGAGYRLLSSPITTSYSDVLNEVWTQGASAGADASTGNPNVFTWSNSATNGANTNWTGVTDLSTNITAGTGFLVYIYADDNYDGSNDAFPKTLSVTGTENSNVTSLTTNANANGWTLVGNPFAVSIDFDDTDKTNLTDVAYVYDPNANSGSGDWETWNGSSGDLTDGKIQPFQGFFIQNASSGSPDIDILTSDKTSGGTFYGKITKQKNSLRLELDGESVSNSVWLEFTDTGSFQEKVLGDALELVPLSSKYAQLAVVKGNELFDIANLALPNNSYEIPLEVSSTEAGSYKLNFSSGELPADVEILFLDKLLGHNKILDESFSYSFEIEKNVSSKTINPNDIIKEPLKAKIKNSNRFSLIVSSLQSVFNQEELSPYSFTLDQNYPNPFNPKTNITYSLEQAGLVSLDIYNALGQRVTQLVNKSQSPGRYNVQWDASVAPTGIYYYRLEVGGISLTRKMTLIK